MGANDALTSTVKIRRLRGALHWYESGSNVGLVGVHNGRPSDMNAAPTQMSRKSHTPPNINVPEQYLTVK